MQDSLNNTGNQAETSQNDRQWTALGMLKAIDWSEIVPHTA